ncbi:MAG TPA: hypothetical protein VIJ95_08800 [Hanamia sp.]
MRQIYTSYFTISLAIILLLSSCATLLNQPIQRIFISTDKNIKAVSISKSLSADCSLLRIDAPTIYYIARSTKPLEVDLQLDSTKKTIFLKARNSFAFWANIENYGIGMLVDKDNIKRYAYPKRNYFNIKDTTIKRYAFAPIRKGTINLSLSWPFPSFFSLQSETGNYNSVGVLGLQTGIDYFYKNNQYVSLNFGAATDVFGDYFGPYFESGNTVFTSIMNNNVVGSFDLGYGISLSKFQWKRTTIGDTINLDQSIKSTALGFSLSAQYRFGNYFRFGFLYQPDFVRLNRQPALKYQHYFSFNFIWKLPIKNATENKDKVK